MPSPQTLRRRSHDRPELLRPVQLIIVPAHNEGATLPEVLARIGSFHHGPILVVDDGSTDQTARLALEAGAKVCSHETRQGYGAALISGFRHAVEGGFEQALTMDADGQHDPQFIPDFWAALKHCDIASGTRYHAAAEVVGQAPPERQAINAEITARLVEATGYPLTDAFCGYKGYRVDALRRLQLDEKGYAFPLQFWVRAYKAGLVVREVAVSRLYTDAERRFGGGLDVAQARRAHYLAVLERELA